MPEITRQLPDLAASGPTMPIRLWVPEAVQTTMRPLDIIALIDTGAPTTMFNDDLVDWFSLTQVGKERFATVVEYGHEFYTYRIRLLFPDNIAIEVVAVAVPNLARRVPCMIGRDVLKHCMLFYDGKTNSFALHF
jgi:hypothetical protein